MSLEPLRASYGCGCVVIDPKPPSHCLMHPANHWIILGEYKAEGRDSARPSNAETAPPPDKEKNQSSERET